MRSKTLLLAATITLAAGLPAQMDMAPAKELAKYDQLLGHWKATGTSVGQPGMPEMDWESTSTYKKVLGGHWIQEDTRITFGEQMPGALCFRSFHGWDKENKRYVAIGVSNMGEATLDEVHWVDDKTMVINTTGMEMGEPAIERWVTKIAGDKLSFVAHRAIGGGELGRFIKGQSTRTETAGKPIDGEGTFFAQPGQPMAKLGKITGSYTFKGKMSGPETGGAEVPISGAETVKMIWGGTICEMHTKGDAMEGMPAGMPTYEAWGAMGWSPAKRCYISVSVSNMGEVGATEGRWVDGALVFTASVTKQGSPMVMRMVLEVGDKGMESIVAHALSAKDAPSTPFQGTYTRTAKN